MSQRELLQLLHLQLHPNRTLNLGFTSFPLNHSGRRGERSIRTLVAQCAGLSQVCTLWRNDEVVKWRRIRGMEVKLHLTQHEAGVINFRRHEDVWGDGGIAPRINLGTRWSEWSASRAGFFTPRGKISLYPLDGRLGGPQSRSGRGGEEKKIPALTLPRIQPRSSNL
jgi:hypothetical protein